MARTESGGAELPDVDSPQSALAKAIYDAKQHAGLSQREIGRQVGVDQTVVSTWVRGVAMPSVERILALDRMFGFRPGTLLERAGLVEPRSTEEAIAAEGAIDDDDKSLLQEMVAARRSTKPSSHRAPTPVDDFLLLSRDRLHEVIDKAVAEALALRRETATAGDATADVPVTGALRRAKSPFDHRQQRMLAARSPASPRAPTSSVARGRRGGCH